MSKTQNGAKVKAINTPVMEKQHLDTPLREKQPDTPVRP